MQIFKFLRSSRWWMFAIAGILVLLEGAEVIPSGGITTFVEGMLVLTATVRTIDRHGE